MIYATHDVRVELGRVWYIPPLRLWNNGIHHSIVFHCFAHGFPLTVEPTENLCLHWKSINENTGFYSTIDGETAYSVSGNKITFQLSPELLENEYPVFIHVGVLDDDGKCCGSLTQEVALYVKQIGIKIDPKAVNPYICSYYKNVVESETGSTANIAVTVSNIDTDLVTDLYVEYAMRPVWDWIKENTPIAVHFDKGEWDLKNPGHIYEVELPWAYDYVFRAVLKYVDYDGNSHTLYDYGGRVLYEGLDGGLSLAPCSVCKGIHTAEWH